ncbi:MAG: ferredoxin [Mycobacterium sp.]|nr:ferredoxin [Mycobacterium sp.]
MKVNVDYDRCEGHGLCVMQAAEAFALTDDGDLDYQFDGQDVPAELEGDVRSAIDACPVAALSEKS